MEDPVTQQDHTPGEPFAADWPGAPPNTGDPVIDARLAPLAELPELPLADHRTAYEAVHEDLRAALDDSGTDA